MVDPRAPVPVWRRPAAIAALLFALTFALYARTSAFAFVNYDDDVYVTRNPHVFGGLSCADARWAFTSGYAANWHPLTWLSHQLDVQLFQLDPGAHHRTSALLHALNAALLYLALTALTGASGRSALVAALFAWHPLRVESVAWVAERKDLLSAAFSFAALLAWARYVRGGARAAYGLALALFALGLLAKPMGVTFPCVLLLLDVWPLARRARGVTWRSLLLEKVPFFALALGSCAVTWLVQRAGGAFGSFESLGLEARIANSFLAYATYVGRTFWPAGASVFHLHPAYAHPERSPWTLAVLAALLFLVLVSVALVRLRRRAPYALVGWLWFLGTLVPVIGLVQVGWQGWAERYSYFPCVGLALALVWGVHALASTPRARNVALAVSALALLALAATTSADLATWRDSRALFERAVAVDEANPVAHNNLGEALEQAGDLAGARVHYARSLELHPSTAPVRVNLARVLRGLGQLDEARAELERALADDPELPRAHADLGTLLFGLGRESEALVHLRRARALLPEDEAVLNVLAWLLATSPSAAAPEEALALVTPLCERPGALAGTLETRAAALARLGRYAEAVEWQTRALELGAGPHTRERLELYRNGHPFVRPP